MAWKRFSHNCISFLKIKEMRSLFVNFPKRSVVEIWCKNTFYKVVFISGIKLINTQIKISSFVSVSLSIYIYVDIIKDIHWKNIKRRFEGESIKR